MNRAELTQTLHLNFTIARPFGNRSVPLDTNLTGLHFHLPRRDPVQGQTQDTGKGQQVSQNAS